MIRCCIALGVLVMLASCASQIPPTGGDKDVTPPQVIHTSPANLSTHFKARKISITFDEFVQLNDASNQIFFSPAISGKVSYRLHGRSLFILLPDSLKPNTTYTINFGAAISDNHEGNKLLNYQYVFSTGAAIDSFRVTGDVMNAADGKYKAGWLVSLYRDADDSAMLKQRPDYNARTDSSGHFVLAHLAEGHYRLFALDDKDFNLMYNPAGEPVAFLDSAIYIHDTTAVYHLELFMQPALEQSVIAASSHRPGMVSIYFARRTHHLQVVPLDTALKIFTGYNDSRDTISCQVNDMTSDSLSFKLHDDDFDDTVRVRMKVVATRGKAAPPKLQVNAASGATKGSAVLKHGEPLYLDFSAPVVDMNVHRSITVIDTAKKSTAVSVTLSKDSANGKQLGTISFPFRQDEKYTLLIPDSSFVDLYGHTNDTTRISVRIFNDEELGNLSVRFTFADSMNGTPYFFELRTDRGLLVARRSCTAQQADAAQAHHFQFTGMVPGNYTLRVIEDRNSNFIWDSGNYWTHDQPEKVFFYEKDITLRANWDVELTMKVPNAE